MRQQLVIEVGPEVDLTADDDYARPARVLLRSSEQVREEQESQQRRG